jgi:hypothetical protein
VVRDVFVVGVRSHFKSLVFCYEECNFNGKSLIRRYGDEMIRFAYTIVIGSLEFSISNSLWSSAYHNSSINSKRRDAQQ